MHYNSVHPQPSLEYSQAGISRSLLPSQQIVFKVYDESEQPHNRNGHSKTQFDSRDNFSPSSQNNLKIMTHLIEPSLGVNIQYPKDFIQQQTVQKLSSEMQNNPNHAHATTEPKNFNLNHIPGPTLQSSYNLNYTNPIIGGNSKDAKDDSSSVYSPYCEVDKDSLNLSECELYLDHEEHTLDPELEGMAIERVSKRTLEDILAENTERPNRKVLSVITIDSSESEERKQTINELREDEKLSPQAQPEDNKESKEALKEQPGKTEHDIQAELKSKSKKEKKKNQSSLPKNHTKNPSKVVPKINEEFALPKILNVEHSVGAMRILDSVAQLAEPYNGGKKADSMDIESKTHVNNLTANFQNPLQKERRFLEDQKVQSESGNDQDFVEPGLNKKVKISGTTFVPTPTRTLRKRDPNSRIKYTVNLEQFGLTFVDYKKDNGYTYKVFISAKALLVINLHSHLSKCEIIGLLAGRIESNQIYVNEAFPCKHVSTGSDNVEMDPESQYPCILCVCVKNKSRFDANNKIQKKGWMNLGWYHSHPTFRPTPSHIDQDNHFNLQKLFKDRVYIGIIISPYGADQKKDGAAKDLFVFNVMNGSTFQLNHSLNPNTHITIEDFETIQNLVSEFQKLKEKVDLDSMWKKTTSHQNKMLQSIELLLRDNFKALGDRYNHTETLQQIKNENEVIFIDSEISIQNLLTRIQNLLPKKMNE